MIKQNRHKSIVFYELDIRVLRSAYLEICYAIRINNFEERFMYSRKKCVKIFEVLEYISKRYLGKNDKIRFNRIHVSKLQSFCLIIDFVKKELEFELHTRTGFSEINFDCLSKRIRILLNYRNDNK